MDLTVKLHNEAYKNKAKVIQKVHYQTIAPSPSKYATVNDNGNDNYTVSQ